MLVQQIAFFARIELQVQKVAGMMYIYHPDCCFQHIRQLCLPGCKDSVQLHKFCWHENLSD